MKAFTKDGRITECKATEENIGKGRCNHVFHDCDYFNQESFQRAVSAVKCYGNNKAKELATDFMARLQNKFGSKIRTKENTLKEIKVVNGKELTTEKKETTRGLILIQDSKTRGGYGICKSKDTYILVEPFFGSNNDESLKFSVEKDVVDLFVKFIKENI